MRKLIYIISAVLLLVFSSGAHAIGCFDAEPDFNDCKLKADQGDAKAQFNLGQMYRSGDGVEQDYKEALRWYRKAVAQRHARARYWLGVMSAKGQGLSEEDIKERRERRERREQAEQRSKKRPQATVSVSSKGQGGKQEGIEKRFIDSRAFSWKDLDYRAWITASGKPCGQVTLKSLSSESKGERYVSVACSGGERYMVKLPENALDKVRIMECSLLKLVGLKCFEKM